MFLRESQEIHLAEVFSTRYLHSTKTSNGNVDTKKVLSTNHKQIQRQQALRTDHELNGATRSCMSNMRKVVNVHSSKLSKIKRSIEILCNWQNSIDWQLDEKCLSSTVVYSAEVISNDKQFRKFYLDISKTKFKTFVTITILFQHKRLKQRYRTFKIYLKTQEQKQKVKHQIFIKTGLVSNSCNLFTL